MTITTSPHQSHAGGGIGILLILVLAAAQSTLTAAFSFTIPKLNPANPALQELSQAQDGILVNLRLDVGQKEDSHLLVDGLVVKLSDETIDKKDKNSVPLPGSSGPNPHLSSGAKSLRVLDAARFIGHGGTNHIDLQDGCWEMVSQQYTILVSHRKFCMFFYFYCHTNINISSSLELSSYAGLARGSSRRRHCLRFQSR